VDDQDLEYVYTEGDTKTRRTRNRFVKYLATQARLELGLSGRTQDQIIQAREWMVRYCKENNVRKDDMIRAIPFAIQIAFLETVHERNARRMTLTENYQDRYSETQEQLVGLRKVPWYLGFINRVHEPEVPPS